MLRAMFSRDASPMGGGHIAGQRAIKAHIIIAGQTGGRLK
jgi:hypothetical protein